MARGRRGLLPGLLLPLLLLVRTCPAPGIEVARVNRHILAMTPLMTDPLSLPPVMDKGVLLILARAAELPREEPLYFRDGTPAPPAFFHGIKENMDLKDIPYRVHLTPAMVVRPTVARCLPTEESLFKSPQEAAQGDIDVNTSTAIPPGTPLMIAHTTRDGQWALTLSTYNPGWVPTQDLVTTTREEMKDYITRTPFVVTTVAHCPVFPSPWEETPLFTLPMGTRVPLVGARRGFYKILLPSPGPIAWKEFYIPSRLANRGYLPFNGNTLMEEAYNLLGEPYSWGGVEGVDCSLLVREVFATTGIVPPRNSYQQAQVGSVLWTPSQGRDLERVLESAPRGRTLIFLPGHVMLYAGRDNRGFKVLHSLYSWKGEKVERVVLTPLRPFMERVTRVTTIP